MRLRPILMTTFALIAGMMPVAIGLGEGGEFYRPMAVAIIGGTITSTLLTLLVVPTFYDSIEWGRITAMGIYSARIKRHGLAGGLVLGTKDIAVGIFWWAVGKIVWFVKLPVRLAKWVARRGKPVVAPVAPAHTGD